MVQNPRPPFSHSVTHHSFSTVSYYPHRLVRQVVYLMSQRRPTKSPHLHQRKKVLASFVSKLAVFSILWHYFSTLFSKLFSTRSLNQCSPPPLPLPHHPCSPLSTHQILSPAPVMVYYHPTLTTMNCVFLICLRERRYHLVHPYKLIPPPRDVQWVRFLYCGCGHTLVRVGQERDVVVIRKRSLSFVCTIDFCLPHLVLLTPPWHNVATFFFYSFFNLVVGLFS